MATNQGFKSFVPKDDLVHPEFLFHWLRFHRAYLESLGNGATFKEVSKGVISRVEINLPALEEQRRIAAILDQTETLRAQRRTALALLDSLTQSLFLDMFGAGESHGWPITSIGEIVDEENGGIRTGPFGSQLLHSEFVDEGVAVLGIDNAVNNEFRWGERRYITHAKYEELKRYTVRPGDVLITIMGTCGRCAVVPGDIPLAINTKHLCCISIDRRRVVPDYLHAYFLRHPTARKYLEQTAKGAIMSGLNMGIIKAMPIALPPPALQQAFATRIASIEALKATHRRALAALDALFASLQQRAFSGELTLAIPRSPTQSLTQLQQLEASIGQEALIFIAKRMPDGDLYNSLKAIYFADRHHLEHHGRQIYNETYSALQHGPVPQSAYEATQVLIGKLMFSSFDDDAVRAALRRQGNTLTALRDADFSKLSRAVIESLEWGIRYCRDMKFGQTKTASHDSAYERTPKNEAIPLQYIIDTLPPEARQRHWNL